MEIKEKIKQAGEKRHIHKKRALKAKQASLKDQLQKDIGQNREQFCIDNKLNAKSVEEAYNLMQQIGRVIGGTLNLQRLPEALRVEFCGHIENGRLNANASQQTPKKGKQQQQNQQQLRGPERFYYDKSTYTG